MITEICPTLNQARYKFDTSRKWFAENHKQIEHKIFHFNQQVSKIKILVWNLKPSVSNHLKIYSKFSNSTDSIQFNMTTSTVSEFGLGDKISKGLHRQVDEMHAIHPIEMSERHFAKNQEKAWNDQLRKMQGLHAPLKLMFEKRAVAKVGHFACMSARSNFQLDILEGNDDMITFNDILAPPEHNEGMSQPQDAIERQIKLMK